MLTASLILWSQMLIVPSIDCIYMHIYVVLIVQSSVHAANYSIWLAVEYVD